MSDPRALFEASAAAPDPANLKGTVLEREDRRFVDLDIESLDALEPTTDRRR